MARSPSEETKLVDQIRRRLERLIQVVNTIRNQVVVMLPGAMRPVSATNTPYDDSTTSLGVDNVQAALDALWLLVQPLGTPGAWDFTNAVNSGHMLVATWD